jgi:hypothetical protein
MSYLATIRQFADSNDSVESSNSNREISEKSEISQIVNNCVVCTCQEYIVALHLSCPTCDGAVCARCGGGLKDSPSWKGARQPGKGPSQFN